MKKLCPMVLAASALGATRAAMACDGGELVDFSEVALNIESIEALEEKPTIVVVHGGPGVSHGHLHAFDQLADMGLGVVYYDQRGVGGSSGGVHSPGYSLDAYVADLDRVVEHLGVGRVHLVGHSWGGIVSMAYTASHEEKVASLVLVNSGPPSRQQMRELSGRLEARLSALQNQGVVGALPAFDDGDKDCSNWLGAVVAAFYSDPSKVAHTDGTGVECNTWVMNQTWKQVGDFDLRRELMLVHVPVLLVFGADDPYGLELAADTSEVFGAGIDTMLIEACGHRPQSECPEAFFAPLEDWIEQANGLRVDHAESPAKE